MTSKFMDKLKETLGSDSRPQIPLVQPESASPREIPSRPRIKGSLSPRPSNATLSPPSNHNVLDAAHSPPSVFSQYLGPPTIEHKYPQDSTWRRHSISAQEQHYMR
ncbi:hypothetical protein VFPPC_16385 [Pochonia chlamydosporia 170]|uniref:Uncharacterized protein n=1 Tax=Pochonia chlamydosporia 170 TaxID=1380566 RepID=A0A179FCJ8_METCM|nr:hypothetical protein VFPPC_16385 [Pochonia chlamydosporia 170]OAQ62829.1 hypothetical protein VFPPC_16385 [Pochonia chlamydosporia 170]